MARGTIVELLNMVIEIQLSSRRQQDNVDREDSHPLSVVSSRESIPTSLKPECS